MNRKKINTNKKRQRQIGKFEIHHIIQTLQHKLKKNVNIEKSVQL